MTPGTKNERRAPLSKFVLWLSLMLSGTCVPSLTSIHICMHTMVNYKKYTRYIIPLKWYSIKTKAGGSYLRINPLAKHKKKQWQNRKKTKLVMYSNYALDMLEGGEIKVNDSIKAAITSY